MKKSSLFVALALSALSATAAYADDVAGASSAPEALPALKLPTTTPESALTPFIYQQAVLQNSLGYTEQSDVTKAILSSATYNPVEFSEKWPTYLAKLKELNPEVAAKIEEVATTQTANYQPTDDDVAAFIKVLKNAFPDDYAAYPDSELELAAKTALKNQAKDLAATGLWEYALLLKLNPVAQEEVAEYSRMQSYARQFILQHSLMDHDVEISESLGLGSVPGIKYASGQNTLVKAKLPGLFAAVPFTVKSHKVTGFVTLNPQYKLLSKVNNVQFTGNSIGLGAYAEHALSEKSSLKGLLAVRYHRVKTCNYHCYQNGLEVDGLLKADHLFGTGSITANTDVHYQLDYFHFFDHGATTYTQKLGIGLTPNLEVLPQLNVSGVLALNYVRHSQPKFAAFQLLPSNVGQEWHDFYKKSDWQTRYGVKAQYEVKQNLSVQAGWYHDEYYGANFNSNSYQLDVKYQF